MGAEARTTPGSIVALAYVLVGVVAAVVLGISVAVAPMIAFAIAGIVLLVPLIESPLARLAFVVVGAMAVLNVSETLSASKVVYLLGSGLVVGLVLLRLPSLRGTRAYAEMRTVLHLSFAFAAFVFLEIVLALFSGASPSGVLRESASYLLFAAMPLLAIDARTSSRRDLIELAFVIVGLVATLSYAVDWVSRRDLAVLPVGHIALAGALPAALFCYLSARFLLGRQRLLWAAAAGVVLALLLLTGNRGTIIILLGPLAIALVGRQGRWWRILRLGIVGFLVAIFALITLGYAARAFDVDTSILSSRYESLLHPSALSSDQSYRVRQAETRVAWDVLRSAPMLGAGPGYIFVWTDPLTRLPQSYPYIDSPLQFPAKFGVMGLLFLLGLVMAYGSLLVRLNRSPNVYRAAALGFAATLAAEAFVGPPMSDTGAALGLLLLLTLSLPDGKRGTEAEPSESQSWSAGQRSLELDLSQPREPG